MCRGDLFTRDELGELLGHPMLIRAEEINGQRVLNYGFTAGR